MNSHLDQPKCKPKIWWIHELYLVCSHWCYVTLMLCWINVLRWLLHLQGLGITVFGIAYMFVHDGLVHKRFPVGPIADVPYFRMVAAAHKVSLTKIISLVVIILKFNDKAKERLVIIWSSFNLYASQKVFTFVKIVYVNTCYNATITTKHV